MWTLLGILASLLALGLGLNSGCGAPEIPPELDSADRIYGGQVAVPGSWPWQAGIYTHRFDHFCGGALIDDRHVLTAAHCVGEKKSKTLRVHLGSYARLATDDTEVVYKVKEVCSHPGYKYGAKRSPANDIAIIKLQESVNYTSTISPVCLPRKQEKLPAGSKLYVTGWGATAADTESEKSPELMQGLTEVVPCVRGGSYPGALCGSRAYASSGLGDSGGPVVHRRNDIWTIFGIVIGVPKTAARASPSTMFFADVAHYMEKFILPYTNPKTPIKEIGKLCRLS
ncbi:chymotrypsinogen B-like [Haemaphysalis longicornis]